MCGIAGEIRFDRSRPDAAGLRRMCRTLTHRGPDGEGYLERDGVGLGSRRLAIVDIAGGAQPIFNETGEVGVVFNGEIYNAPALRQELLARGHRLASRSDTEVLVHLYEERGTGLFEAIRGMFAFAIWDASRRRGVVARDRIGIKPLYYTVDDSRLLFASELKAILAALPATPALDAAAIDAYLAHHYIPAPLTVFEGVRKLPAGHFLEISEDRVALRQYWEIDGANPREYAPTNDPVRELRALLESAAEEHLMSDVPLGVFLSGGVDSSIVAALAAARSRQPIRTFSVRFENQAYDEGIYARAVATHLGARHTEETVRADAVDLLPRLARAYDEPFGDPAALPGYLLSEAAARHLKVCLSGDGGDELFGGYRRYQRALRMTRFDGIPRPARAAMARAASALMPRHARGAGFFQKLGDSPGARYQHEFGGFDAAERRALLAPPFSDAVAADGSLFEPYFAGGASDLLTQMELCDLHHYLPECILTKVDRVSMAHSLEVRVPLLDHRVVSMAMALPADLKIRNGETKWILKAACADLLPPGVLDRPKHGFTVPLREWFRVDLKTHAEAMLLGPRAQQRGILRPDAVQSLLDAHARRGRSFGDRIWSLLVLEYWCRAFLDRDAE